MLLTESIQPFNFMDTSGIMDEFRRHIPGSSSSRRHSHAHSMSSYSSISSSGGLRLADVAKQHGMGVHVENWREDMVPVRQYLPMQHIIGSLKRDRDEQVHFVRDEDVPVRRRSLSRRQSEAAAASPRSDDSFLQLLRTPKRRRVSDFSNTSSYGTQCTTDSDPDRRFSYQSADHPTKDIPPSALPGLNHVLNLATITADERDIFSEYAPKHLDDPQLLMNEVLQLREQMMGEDAQGEEGGGSDGKMSTVGTGSPIISPERDAEVRKAFENFIDLDGRDPFIAEI